ncbi:hypothetical protein M413DRAFT_353815 [Hebeloma cylindrosporum]|uniref:BTB domain-containing protein n=1 Tax=Hebeloma cylindrosporum TaxID=76867 RepID=A0A0C3C6E7_HEBCY|nr:hypothetical protein M413DRAFT_353815 [Hebeloma cylindrosporum h7]
MFSLPQTQHDIPSPSGLHIVPVAEDSKALRILILHCYPLDLQDEENDVIDIARAIVAARKYVMDIAEKRMEKILFSKALSLVEDRPLHIYALACRYGFEELGRAAVRRTLEIRPYRLSPSPELKHISGMDMYQLNQCRHRCAHALWDWYFGTKHAFEDQGSYGEPIEVPYVWFDERPHNWIKEHNKEEHTCTFEWTRVLRQDDWSSYISPDLDEDNYIIYATSWWTTYFVQLMKAIEVCPTRRTVFKFSDQAYYDALAASSSCTFCRLDAARHLDYFKEDFAKKLDEIVTQAVGELEFQTP